MKKVIIRDEALLGADDVVVNEEKASDRVGTLSFKAIVTKQGLANTKVTISTGAIANLNLNAVKDIAKNVAKEIFASADVSDD